MSLAAPTRPLPTSPSSGPSELPSRSNSVAGPSKKVERSGSHSSPNRTVVRLGSENDSDVSRRDSERSKAADRLAGQSNGRSTPVNGPPKPHVQINGQSEDATTWGANFWVTIQDPMVSSSAVELDFSALFYEFLLSRSDPIYLLRMPIHRSDQLGSSVGDILDALE